jgi:hypothetical protein
MSSAIPAITLGRRPRQNIHGALGIAAMIVPDSCPQIGGGAIAGSRDCAQFKNAIATFRPSSGHRPKQTENALGDHAADMIAGMGVQSTSHQNGPEDGEGWRPSL